MLEQAPLVVLAAVARWRPPEPRWARGWLGLEGAARAVVVRPTLHVAEQLARFDDRVLDRAVMATAGSAFVLARRLAVFDASRLDGLVEWSATHVRRLGAIGRRPQTGQLHHYYLQAVAVLTVGVLLLRVDRTGEEDHRGHRDQREGQPIHAEVVAAVHAGDPGGPLLEREPAGRRRIIPGPEHGDQGEVDRRDRDPPPPGGSVADPR
jgi:hypothetical protein